MLQKTLENISHDQAFFLLDDGAEKIEYCNK